MAEESGTTKVPEERSVFDAAADFLQTLVDWLRQEAGAIFHEKIVMPLQRVGLALASAWAAVLLLVLGMCFISVGSLLLLAKWLTWPGALFAIGGVLVLGSIVFTVLKIRNLQR